MFNYSYYREDGSLAAKGSMTNEGVPNGEFFFYSSDGSEIARGLYATGHKDSIWRYSLDGNEFLVDWDVVHFKKLSFPLPSGWHILDQDSMAISYGNQSLGFWEKLSIGTVSIDERVNALNEIVYSFLSDAKEQGISLTTDYSDILREEFHEENVWFFEMAGSNGEGGKELKSFACFVFDQEKSILIRILYVVEEAKYDGLFPYVFSTEVILDTQYEGKMIFDRWQVE